MDTDTDSLWRIQDVPETPTPCEGGAKVRHRDFAENKYVKTKKPRRFKVGAPPGSTNGYLLKTLNEPLFTVVVCFIIRNHPVGHELNVTRGSYVVGRDFTSPAISVAHQVTVD